MPDDCILYAGRLHASGYPRLRINGRTTRFNRAMYEKFVGPIPDGYHVHHSCGVRHCINPEHLVAIAAGDHSRLHDSLGNRAKRDKTHCVNGHERTPENIYVHPSTGARSCRVCRSIRRRAASKVSPA